MMPYDYQKLSPEERKELLHSRAEKGHPLHEPPHFYGIAGHYLLTAANYRHAAIMVTPSRRSEWELRMLAALSEVGAEVFAWVVLPNHYHVLIAVESLKPVARALGQLNGVTACEWNLQDGQTGKRKVWYRFVDRLIRSEAHFLTALNYIHYNPVKHGYTDDPYQWTWSSLSDYLECCGREWLRENWRSHPLREMGRGWDQ